MTSETLTENEKDSVKQAVVRHFSVQEPGREAEFVLEQALSILKERGELAADSREGVDMTAPLAKLSAVAHEVNEYMYKNYRQIFFDYQRDLHSL